MSIAIPEPITAISLALFFVLIKQSFSFKIFVSSLLESVDSLKPMSSIVRIKLNEEKCNNCGRCVKSCPTGAWKGESGYIVSFGGLFGNKIYKGEQIVPIIKDKDTLFRVTDAAINWFEKNANPSERFRYTLQRVGEEDFRKEIKAAYEGE